MINCTRRNVVNMRKKLQGDNKRFVSIYTTKIATFVCPPHISYTVAVRIMKLPHRPLIASTTKKLISKPIIMSIFINFITKNAANQGLHFLFSVIRPTPFISAFASLGHPSPGSGKIPSCLDHAMRLPSLGDRDRIFFFISGD